MKKEIELENALSLYDYSKQENLIKEGKKVPDINVKKISVFTFNQGYIKQVYILELTNNGVKYYYNEFCRGLWYAYLHLNKTTEIFESLNTKEAYSLVRFEFFFEKKDVIDKKNQYLISKMQ